MTIKSKPAVSTKSTTQEKVDQKKAESEYITNKSTVKTQIKHSNMDIAKEIYKKNKKKSRKELIELFIKEAKLSKAGFSTYVYNVKRMDLE